MILRDKEVVFLEFEHLLNLFFRNGRQPEETLWKRDPFLRVLQTFCQNASRVASREELRNYVLRDWMQRKQAMLNQNARNSVHELVDTYLPSRN